MSRRRAIKNMCIWAVLCLLLTGTVSAKQTGSLTLKNVTGDVCLYQVADKEGVLTEDFAKAGITVAENAAENKESARLLQKYARDKSVFGEEKTPANGVASFADLKEGCYLVCSMASKQEFVPFLVWIPTSLDREKLYDIQATPKTESTQDPTTPGSSTPSEPNIPQTGSLLWPQYVLLGLGTVLMILGTVEVIKGRRKADE